MADQNNPLASANSINGNTADAPAIPHIVSSSSESELTSNTFRFLAAKNSMEFHKNRHARHERSLPSMFEPEDYAKVGGKLGEMGVSINSNNETGASSLASDQNSARVKKKVEWVDLRRSHARQLVTAQEYYDADQMDTSESEFENGGSESESEPVFAILKPPQPVDSIFLETDSQTILPSDTDTDTDTEVESSFRSRVLAQAVRLNTAPLNHTTDLPFIGSYERPIPNPFDAVAQTLSNAQSHLQQQPQPNYETLRTLTATEQQQQQQKYFTPRNTQINNANWAASQLIGQYCTFPQENNIGREMGMSVPEYPAQVANMGSAMDLGGDQQPQPQLPDNPQQQQQQHGDHVHGQVYQVEEPQEQDPTHPIGAEIYMDDDDDDLLDVDKPAPLPRIEDMWVPTVANVAAITPPELHHLIEVNYKKDCRTWLWKSAHQRAQRYNGHSSP